MSTTTTATDVIPECVCGMGKMKLLCAGKDAQHTGRWFYKCPIDANHSGSFFWCDDYHSRHGDGKLPDYVLNQTWRPEKKERNTHEEKNKRRARTPHGCGRCHVEIKMNFVLGVIGLVLLVLGFVLGKIF